MLRNAALSGLQLVALPAMLLPMTGWSATIFDTAGPVAEGERIILLDSVAIMLAVIIPTMLAIGAFAWWFRAGNTKAKYLPRWAYSGQLELMVWSVPALVVMFLGGIAWIGSHELDPAKPLASTLPPLEVEVVSLDWRWLFIYPQQHIASINHLVLPLGQPVHLRLTSATVMNVFFIPRVASEIYTMNGMATQLNLQVDKPGTYQGISAHYSGDGFSDMHFDVDAVTPAKFANWQKNAAGHGAALDAANYRTLLKQSHDTATVTYHSVEPGLFDAIVAQTLPPGDGSQLGSN